MRNISYQMHTQLHTYIQVCLTEMADNMLLQHYCRIIAVRLA